MLATNTLQNLLSTLFSLVSTPVFLSDMDEEVSGDEGEESEEDPFAMPLDEESEEEGLLD